MTDYIFIFDLDSTITKKEMRELTEATMRGEMPFKTSFLERVKLLSQVKVSEVNQLVSEIPLNTEIARFICENKDRCYVLTGNLDVWISGLMKKIAMKEHVYCSKANVQDDNIAQVISVIDKEFMIKQFVQPMVVIGDGDNDAGMARFADVSIGFGGVRNIAPSLLRCIDYAFYDDKRCADFLRTLL